jgi:hypothetical protein
VLVKPWVDAVALDPFHDPTRLDISEQPELRAFQQTRASLLFAAHATLSVDWMPDGGTMQVDGLPVDVAGGAAVSVQPGRHRICLFHGDALIAREDLRLAANERHEIVAPPLSSAVDALASQLRTGAPQVPVSPRMQAVLDRLPRPAEVAVHGDGDLVVYDVDGGALVKKVPPPVDPKTDPKRMFPADVRIWAGAAWLHDRAWYTTNAGAGAKDSFATVNAAAPTLGIGATWALPFRVAGVAGDTNPKTGEPWLRYAVAGGVDVMATTGEYNRLPAGDGGELRVRAAPYVGVGFEQAQLTFGAVFPWDLGIGLRFAVPILGRADLTGALVQGIGPLGKEAEDVDAPRYLFLGLSAGVR